MEFLAFPLIAAFVGWVTNYIAVKMLFRPIHPVRFLGLTIQGVIPRRINQIVEKMARIVEKEFISVEDITKTVKQVRLEQEVEILSGKLIDSARQMILKKFPLPPSIGDPLFKKMQNVIFQEMIGNLSLFVEKIVIGIREGADPREIVIAKTQSHDIAGLERMALEVAGRELKYIEIYGGVLGFAVGLVHVVLFRIFWVV
ncbi:MAG: DUF445 family protein [Deltaproteobacteria bacterium]|nr:DUF445 family protein [Deltaproteobacteria bacterium]